MEEAKTGSLSERIDHDKSKVMIELASIMGVDNLHIIEVKRLGHSHTKSHEF